MPPSAVKGVRLEPTLLDEAAPATGLAPRQDDSLVLMFERLARDPGVDVGKLEKLIDLQIGIITVNAKATFDAAYSAMQQEIPEIDERGRVLNKHGEVQSQYAKFEDIQKVIKPILARHGFSLKFKTTYPDGKTLVTGILGHSGHEETSEFRSDPDDSGGKNKIQGLGSANSYGRRYTTIDLLNITTRGVDDDGQKAGKPPEPEAPDGYVPWLAVLDGISKSGDTNAFKDAWNNSSEKFRNHVAATAPGELKAMKKRAGLKV